MLVPITDELRGIAKRSSFLGTIAVFLQGHGLYPFKKLLMGILAFLLVVRYISFLVRQILFLKFGIRRVGYLFFRKLAT